MSGITDLDALIASMGPSLDPAVYVWASVPGSDHPATADAVATVREDEGLTLVLEQSRADQRGLAYEFPSARVTLQVRSALEAVGLTAVFSRALGDAGISANVVAGFHHDHIFVPVGCADDAMATLRALAAGQ